MAAQAEAALKCSQQSSHARVMAFAGLDADAEAALTSTSYCYDVDATWSANIRGLPPACRDSPPVERPWAPQDKWLTFIGHKLASPLGVAAGPLLSSEWVALAARRGYDCLTYKTIRSHAHAGHGLPNILYLDVNEQLQAAGPSCQGALPTRPPYPPGIGIPPSPEAAATCAAAATKAAATGAAPLLAITNSFGMPSQGPEELAGDLPAAAAALRPGQMMVVSVTGTPGRPGVTFSEDLALAASTALAGGATAIEVNLSCPNVGCSHVALYQDAAAVEATVAGLAQVVGGVPLILKVGAYPDADSLRRVMQGAASAGAAAFAGINGLSRRVELPAALGGGPALGPDRPTSGVCGDPIRGAGLEFVSQARQIITSSGLELGLIGVGGVTQAGHVMQYLEAGADVVQAATGFMWRPDLGADFQRMWAAAGYTLPTADGRR